MRIIVAAFSLFFFKNKSYRGKNRKWERRKYDLPQREEGREKRGGRKKGKWKARRKRAHLLEGAEKVHCEVRMQRHARWAAL